MCKEWVDDGQHSDWVRFKGGKWVIEWGDDWMRNILPFLTRTYLLLLH